MRTEIKYQGKVVAIIYKNNGSKGLTFITTPEDPLQVGFHNYLTKKITNIHITGNRSPEQISDFNKFLYILNGSATVYLMQDKRKVFKKVKLINNECIIIMNIFHKVVFNENTNAIEIKQGPYKQNT